MTLIVLNKHAGNDAYLPSSTIQVQPGRIAESRFYSFGSVGVVNAEAGYRAYAERRENSNYTLRRYLSILMYEAIAPGIIYSQGAQPLVERK